MIKEFIKKRFILFALILLLITSIGFTIKANTKLDSVKREVTGVVSTFEPNYECKGNSLKFFCFSVTSTLKTCYTLPDKQGGKRCLETPYWVKIESGEPIVIDIDEPTHKCASNGNEFYCHSLTSSLKTCYTELNNTGAKRCLVDPYWEEITDCPECEEQKTCPVVNLTCPSTPCIQTCKGCGGGSGSSDCPQEKVCINNEDVQVLAYIPNEDCTETKKLFCYGIGKENQRCLDEELSEIELEELCWHW